MVVTVQVGRTPSSELPRASRNSKTSSGEVREVNKSCEGGDGDGLDAAIVKSTVAGNDGAFALMNLNDGYRAAEYTVTMHTCEAKPLVMLAKMW